MNSDGVETVKSKKERCKQNLETARVSLKNDVQSESKKKSKIQQKRKLSIKQEKIVIMITIV